MARKRKLSLNDLGSISVTPVNRIEGHITNLRDFQKQYDADEKAKAEAPARKIVAESQAKVSAVLAEHSARVAKFWRLPIASIEDYLRFGDAVADNIFLPTTETLISMKEFDDILARFVDSISTKGVTLTQAGSRRLALYAYMQHQEHSVINDETLAICLTRLINLKVFGNELSGELAKPIQQATEPESSTTQTFDNAVQGLNPESREGRKQILAVVGDHFTTEVAAFVGLWLDNIAKNYQCYPTPAVIKRALKYVVDMNLNPLAYKTWDLVRVNFTKNGWLLKPDGSQMLTEREKLAAYCDTADLNSRDVRRQINLRNLEIQESEPAYAPHK